MEPIKGGALRVYEHLRGSALTTVDLSTLSSGQIIDVLTVLMQDSKHDGLHPLIRHVQRSRAYEEAIHKARIVFAEAERECGDA